MKCVDRVHRLKIRVKLGAFQLVQPRHKTSEHETDYLPRNIPSGVGQAVGKWEMSANINKTIYIYNQHYLNFFLYT